MEHAMGKGHPKKRAGKMPARKAIGALMILAGAGVFCYPLCVQAYNAYEQKRMIEELRADIAMSLASTAILDGWNLAEAQKEVAKEGGKEAAGTVWDGECQEKENLQKESPQKENKEAVLEQEERPEEGQKESAVGNGPEENTEGEAGREEARPDRLNGKKVIGLIEIETISLIYPIVEGTETGDIGVAIGHMAGTAELGAVGNCALAGHRGGYSGPYFKRLDELEAGDKVVITDAKGGVFSYQVTEHMVVEPTEVWVAEDTGEEKAVLTLITCEENGEKRLVIRCELEE